MPSRSFVERAAKLSLAAGDVTLDRKHHGMGTTAEFLDRVFVGEPAGALCIFCKPSKHPWFVPFNRNGWASQAESVAIEARSNQNVYFAIGSQCSPPNRGRGTEVRVIAIPGLWGDIDVMGPNHTSVTLPPTIEDAWRILRA